MNKKLSFLSLVAIVLASSLTLSGCASEAERATTEEEKAFESWSLNVDGLKVFTYNSQQKVSETASDIITSLNNINQVVPEGRFNIDLSLLAGSDWKNKVCSAGEKNEQGFLKEPIIGSIDLAKPEFNGYINKAQIEEISKLWNNSRINENNGWDGFYETQLLYPYYKKQYITQIATENFDVILLADNGWNALLWNQYKYKGSPEKIDYTNNPQPTDAYMPFEVLVFYKGNCNN